MIMTGADEEAFEAVERHAWSGSAGDDSGTDSRRRRVDAGDRLAPNLTWLTVPGPDR
jgi:hypothetical protein